MAHSSFFLECLAQLIVRLKEIRKNIARVLAAHHLAHQRAPGAQYLTTLRSPGLRVDN